MKILVYGINFSPELTGIGKYTGEMCEWLVNDGNEVDVITSPPYYPNWHVEKPYKSYFYKKEKINGLNIYRCPLYVPKSLNTIKRIIHLLSFSISSILVLISRLFSKPDIVIVIAPSFMCSPGGLFFSKLAGAKTVLHVQDFELDAMFGLGMMRRGRFSKIIFWLESFIMKRFDLVSTISRKMMQILEQKNIPKEKIFFLPNWVDIDFIKPKADNNFFNNNLKQNQATKTVLYSGNIGNKQGLEIIIDAAFLMRDQKNIQFVICGNGSYKDNLVDYSTKKDLNNLKFIDLVQYEDLPSLINSATIHLVIQKKDTADAFLPSKLTTILSAGGYAIVSAEKNTELGILNEKFPGIISLVEPENVNELVTSINNLLYSSNGGFNKIARSYAENHLKKDSILSSLKIKLLNLIS